MCYMGESKAGRGEDAAPRRGLLQSPGGSTYVKHDSCGRHL